MQMFCDTLIFIGVMSYLYFTFLNCLFVFLQFTGTHILSASKDNSNRLWDLGMVRIIFVLCVVIVNSSYCMFMCCEFLQSKPIQRYKGHLNTSHNFVTCSFGPLQQIVIGGSEVFTNINYLG